jgi:hypothetical protein
MEQERLSNINLHVPLQLPCCPPCQFDTTCSCPGAAGVAAATPAPDVAGAVPQPEQKLLLLSVIAADTMLLELLLSTIPFISLAETQQKQPNQLNHMHQAASASAPATPMLLLLLVLVCPKDFSLFPPLPQPTLPAAPDPLTCPGDSVLEGGDGCRAALLLLRGTTSSSSVCGAFFEGSTVPSHSDRDSTLSLDVRFVIRSCR